MNRIKSFLYNLERNMCVLLLSVILIILTIQVCGRYVFNNTPEWSEELARYLFIWLIFWGASYAAQQNAHIRIESFNNVWPRFMRKGVAIAGELLWIAFNLVILYESAKYTYAVFDSHQISVAIKIGMGWAYLGIPLGYALMTMRILINLISKKFISNNTAVIENQ
ncbi:MAG: TRAP transporter small permease [Peptococcales bacterium]|nr:TRAP transporter small permease [Bacillota bacterium]